MTKTTAFRRIVLGLHPGMIDRGAFRTAAEMAKLLGLGLHGIFVEDVATIGAARLPFTRELRLPTRNWQETGFERLLLELQVAAEQARAQLVTAGAAVGVTCDFEIRRGDPATELLAACGTADIVAVGEPADAIEGLTGVTGRFREAALSSIGAVLLLPLRIRPSAGPVIAIVRNAQDRALVVAARVASAANLRLLVVAVGDDPRAEPLSAAGFEVLAAPASSLPSLVQVLQGRQGSCVVVNHAIADEGSAAQRLSMELALPVLVVK